MSIDENQLAEFRKSLEADDYLMDVVVEGDGAKVDISAGPNACADCLVPKPLMKTMLAPVLGVEPESIELSYPVDITT